MAINSHIFEIEKNAVIFHYPNLRNLPDFDGQHPVGCCVRYFSYYIGAGHGYRGFSVYGNGISKHFSTLFQAKSFIQNLIYKKSLLI